ncbi:MAG: GNAT family N-acetyltransferase [Planctomycetota bacterium]|nr:GNAT family N-acetyltransferase [Planctomycetota bacterium]
MDEARSAVRAARRSDLHALTDLRLHFLGEAAHADARLRLMPDARDRTEHALPVWMGQADRVLLVGLDPAHDPQGPGADNAAPVAYAMGLLGAVPPVLAAQHVGEILEVHVDPAHRGKGLGDALVAILGEALIGRGAQVLRAAVPSTHEFARARLERAGFAPLQLELERSLDAG